MHYELGPYVFQQKKQILEHCRKLRSELEKGIPLGKSDLGFLLSLFTHHPRYDEKCQGSLVHCVYVGYSDPRSEGARKRKCFRLKLQDGRDVEISAMIAYKGVPPVLYQSQIREIRTKKQRTAEVEAVAVRIARREFPTDLDADVLSVWQLFLKGLGGVEVKAKKRPGMTPSSFEDPTVGAAWPPFYRAVRQGKVA